MNKIYTILGLGLLSAATLSSCQEEAVVQENGNRTLPEGTYSASAVIRSFMSSEGSRANVQADGKSFMWNTDDKVTIWDGTNGYEFTAINYTDDEPSANVEFQGEAALTDGAKVWGIYPAVTNSTAENVFSFTLDYPFVQNTQGTADLKETMFMLAEGTVEGQTIANLEFKHQTALFHFKITNNKSSAIQLTGLKVTADSEIFPTGLNIADGTNSYTDKVKELELNFSTTVSLDAKGGSIDAYMNFFPTQDMNASTGLTITAQTEEGEDLILKEGTVGNLYKETALATTDNFNYAAGKRYGVTATLLPTGDELGYTEENGVYTILNADGIVNLFSQVDIMTKTDTKIVLSGDIDMNDTELSPVAEFKGDFDGNGKTISNFSLVSEDNQNTGMFIVNSGTIRNLTIDNATLAKENAYAGTDINTNAAGLLVGTNKKTVKNCIVRNSEIRSTVGASIGAIVGLNSPDAIIDGCRIESTSIEATDKSNLGGLTGFNDAATISYSFVKEDVTVSYDCSGTTGNSANVGGMAGWSRAGSIKGCGSSAQITSTNVASSIGGLIGSIWFGQAKQFSLEASYAAGSISGSTNGASVGGMVGNAEGACQKTITACYTTTQLLSYETDSDDYGGFIKKATATTCTACFYTNIEAASANNSITGATHIKKEELKEKLTDLNNALTNSEYEFIDNPDSETEPLTIQKKAE